jgi:2,3-bisphosphoglycerate-independent phosphoglycerate mutase
MHQAPMVLLILDGWGVRTDNQYNAINQAHTPTWDRLWQQAPHTTLRACGEDVGLLAGQMGNSEVGHLNIGAGRIIYQDSARISKSIQDGDFFTNPVFINCCQNLKHTNHTLHIMGLLSDGGVHSFNHHLYALIDLACQQGVPNLLIHAFLDGRDTPPKSATQFLSELQSYIADKPQCKIASIMGRFYGMDRDKRWDRTHLAFDCIVNNTAPHTAPDALTALNQAYARNESDEFVAPTLLPDAQAIESGDAVLFFNFRSDRARQLSCALTQTDFNAFARKSMPQLSHFITMTHYADDIAAAVAFAPQQIKNTLGEHLSHQHFKQFRVAETEKYAHVTFFFNGGEETPFPLEDRQLIPSPQVKTYDLKPEMSVNDVVSTLISAIESEQYAVLICNIANADMVGHTGNLEATKQAIEAIDHNLEKLLSCIEKYRGQLLITADHGNAECMFDEQHQQPHTAHTLEPVPLVYVGPKSVHFHKTGRLADIAPTLLFLLDLPIPLEMTGSVLLSCD